MTSCEVESFDLRYVLSLLLYNTLKCKQIIAFARKVLYHFYSKIIKHNINKVKKKSPIRKKNFDDIDCLKFSNHYNLFLLINIYDLVDLKAFFFFYFGCLVPSSAEDGLEIVGVFLTCVCHSSLWVNLGYFSPTYGMGNLRWKIQISYFH